MMSVKKSSFVMASHATSMLPMFMKSPDWHTPACNWYGTSLSRQPSQMEFASAQRAQ